MQQQNRVGEAAYFSQFCTANHKAIYICSSAFCRESQGLVCGETSCSCMSEKHYKCQFVLLKPLTDKLLNKKKPLNSTIEKSLSHIRSIIEQLIQKLSNQRDSLQIFIQSYGLSEGQYKLLELLQTGKSQQISGPLVAHVHSKIFQENTLKNTLIQSSVKSWESVCSTIYKNLRQSMEWCQGYQLSIPEILQREPDPRQKASERHIASIAIRKRWRPVIEWIGNKNSILCGNLATHNLQFYTFLKPSEIHSIPFAFTCLLHLKHLNLANNKIKHIRHLHRLKSLITLDLSNNLILKIQLTEKGFASLSTFLLHQNKIEKVQNLNRTDEELPSLKIVTLFGNPAIIRDAKSLDIRVIEDGCVKKLIHQSVRVFLEQKEYMSVDIKNLLTIGQIEIVDANLFA